MRRHSSWIASRRYSIRLGLSWQGAGRKASSWAQWAKGPGARLSLRKNGEARSLEVGHQVSGLPVSRQLDAEHPNFRMARDPKAIRQPSGHVRELAVLW